MQRRRIKQINRIDRIAARQDRQDNPLMIEGLLVMRRKKTCLAIDEKPNAIMFQCIYGAFHQWQGIVASLRECYPVVKA